MSVKKIGVLGAGQLGRMLALAAAPLDLQCRFYDPTPQSPAGQVAPQVLAEFDNTTALKEFAKAQDIVTFEFENVPVSAINTCAEQSLVLPNARALEVAQNRLAEKTFCQNLSIPTPRFAQVRSLKDLESASEKLGFPCVLKTCRFGYDGKGQAVLRSASDLQKSWETIKSQDLILEEFIQFEREISVILVRSRTGEIVQYPTVENEHRQGILWRSRVPARGTSSAAQRAQEHTSKIAHALDYCGVLAVEYFEKDGQAYFNEMAPRVHNSGHWTIDGAITSQFENHLRAIAGLPLGATAARGNVAMYNILGHLPDLRAVLAIPEVKLHLYGKSERIGRKIGHLTACCKTEQQLKKIETQIEQLLQSRTRELE